MNPAPPETTSALPSRPVSSWVVGLCVASIALLIATMLVRWTTTGINTFELIIGIASIGAFVVPAALVYMGLRTDHATYAFLALGSCSAAAAACVQGGLGATTLSWLVIAPLAAGIIGNLRAVLGLACWTIVLVILVGVLDIKNLLPPAAETLDGHNFLNLIAMLASGTLGSTMFLKKQAQEQAKVDASRRWFSVLAEELEVGAIVVADGAVAYANPLAQRIFGLPEIPEYNDLPVFVQQQIRGESIEQPVNVNGEEKWILVRREGLAEVQGDLYTAIDVTLRKEEEQQRIRAEADFLRTKHLEKLGLLAGSLAHDLNNLLMVMTSNADLLLIGEEDRNKAEMSTDIISAGTQAADIIRQLLAYTGQNHLTKNTLDLAAVLDSTARILRVEAIAKGVRLECVSDPSEPVTIESDETGLREIIGDLISNAIRATSKDGLVRVGIRLHEFDRATISRAVVGSDAETGPYVVVDVKDTGHGIEAKDAGRIFDPFYNTRNEGHGLGLAALQGIVTRVGGLLFLESQIGKGTTFSLCLPAHLQEPQPEGIQSLPTKNKVVKTLPRDLAPVPATLRVLVLDDEPLIRTQVARLLVHDGYEPVLAEDLSEAISALQDAPVGGAIIDFMMPEQTGDVALQILQTYQANLPAVLISGYIGPRDESVTRDFAAVILKPFSQDDFQTTIQRVMPKPSVA